MKPAGVLDPLWAETLECDQRLGIYFAQGIGPEGRILLSSGIDRTVERTYEPDSYVPRGPWVSGDPWIDKLIAHRQNPASQIGLYRFEDRIIDRIRQCCDRRDLADRRSVLEDVVNYCHQHIARIAGRLHIIGLSEACAEGATMTRDMHLSGSPKIGLHVDSWDGAGSRDRATRTQRVCINLGEADRFLLFLNRPITLFDELAGQDANRAVLQFLQRHPNYPVTAIQVRSGEAYMAPTELMVHDGWNPSAGFQDRTFTIRADFLPLAHDHV